MVSPVSASWTKTVLPDSGQNATADAVTCWDTGCAVTGRVDGTAAVWRLSDGEWNRLGGVPAVAVGDRESMIAPVEIGGRLVVAVPDGGQVRLLVWDGTWTTHDAEGPEGRPGALTRVGDRVYLLAGSDDKGLWRTDISKLENG